jgi:hypothetical protein
MVTFQLPDDMLVQEEGEHSPSTEDDSVVDTTVADTFHTLQQTAEGTSHEERTIGNALTGAVVGLTSKSTTVLTRMGIVGGIILLSIAGMYLQFKMRRKKR